MSSSHLAPLSSLEFHRTTQHLRVLEVVMGSARSRVGVPGPAPLMAQRQEFAQLIARGVSNSEACRLVGVNRRTGTRSAHGTHFYADDNALFKGWLRWSQLLALE